MNALQRVLRKIFIAVTGHPFLTLFIALTLAALSIFYTVRNLDFLTSQKDLISPHNRLIRLSEQMDQFEDLDTFVVAIENRDNSRSLKFLHTLVSQLEKDDENYIQVFYRVDPKPFRPWVLLYLDKKDLVTLRDNIQEHRGFIENLVQSPGLTDFFRGVNHEMASEMVGELFTGFLNETPSESDKEPLDLGFLIRVLRELRDWLDGDASYTSPWESFFTEKSWDHDSEEGYFWTENKRYLLLFVTPRKIDKSFVNAQHSLQALRKAIARVQAGFPHIEVGVTGQEALNEDEMGVAFHDMSLATVLSLFGLMGLLVLFWRGFRRPLLEIIELLIALSLTFGLTTLFIGHLNILSVTFAPLLLGLGIDYGIHWFARYQEEEQLRAATKREAIQTTMVKLGPGILLAGFTAALSFFPLVLTGFRGLVELGIITSMGMLMTTATTLCVLPALALIFDKSSHRTGTLLPPARVKHLLKLNNRWAIAILIPATIGLGLSLWGAGKVTFDLNMLRLQSKGAESVIWEKKLLEGSERSSMYGAVLARSLEEVQKKTTALEVLPTVSEVQSIINLLPQDQEDKIDFLRQMKPLLIRVGSPRSPDGSVNLSELDKTLGRIRFKMLDSSKSQWGVSKPLETQMIQVRDLIDQLRHRFHSMERPRLSDALHAFERALIQDLNDKVDILRTNVNAAPMQLEDLPKPLLQRFVSKDRHYLIRVFPSQDIWDPVLLGRFVRDLRSVDPDVIGDPVTLYVFTKAFRDAAIKAAMYAVVFIFTLMLLTFRNLIHAFMVMMPLVVGTAWTMGLMRFLGVDFNLANSIFLPLIVGAGVEYGIIIIDRWRQHEGGDTGNVTLPFSTAKGVILAGLTTTVGFGSLAISDHQGIHSLGLLAMVGSLCILAAAILFLPAFMQLMTNFSERGRIHSTPHLSPKQNINR
ncbi:MAG: MMPL family transporter [Deltaproteobacteria bacterium]|nr:MMPL family transporter [Deltaproteobacteria bacterium]